MIIIFAALVLAVARPGWAAPDEDAAPADDRPRFEEFAILVERNIFDPQRQPHRPREPERPTTATAEAEPATERIALQGVLLRRGEAVAFFEGTEPANTAALSPGDVLAGLKLLEIHTDRVLLTAGEDRLALPVAAQLRRAADGPWEVTTDTTPVHRDAPAAPPKAGSDKPESGGDERRREGASEPRPADSGGNAPAGAQDEVMRKLMERRRKEMGR